MNNGAYLLQLLPAAASSGTLSISVSDSVTVTESVQCMLQSRISVSETTGVYESVEKNRIHNGDLTNIPTLIAPQTSASFRYLDGTASGSATDTGYGWVVALSAGCEVSLDNTNTHDGYNSIHIKAAAGTATEIRNTPMAGAYNTIPGNGVSIRASTQYKLTVWIKAENVTGSAGSGAHINFLGSNQADQQITGYSLAGVIANQGWTFYTSTFTTQATEVRGHLEVRVYSQNGAGTLAGDFYFAQMHLEPTTQADEGAVEVNSFVNKSDSVTVTESLQRLDELNINKSESITVTESKTLLIPDLFVNVSDSATVTESLQRLLESYINKSESATVSESLNISFAAGTDLAINVSESVTVTESLQRMLESYLNKSESVTVTESLARLLESYVSTNDTVSASESLQRLLESRISVSDSSTVTESLQRALESQVTVSESVTVSEAKTVSVTAVPTLLISVSDSVTVTEALTTEQPGTTHTHPRHRRFTRGKFGGRTKFHRDRWSE